MNGELVSSIIIALVALGTGTTVLLKSPKQRVNQIFFLLTISFSVWTATYLLIELAPTTSVASLINKISLSFSVVTTFLYLSLTYIFPKKSNPAKLLKLFLPLAIIGVLSSFTTFVSGDVTVNEEGLFIYEFTTGTALHTLLLLTIITAIFVNLVKDYQKSTARIQKAQIRYILFGLISGALVGLSLMVLVAYALPESRLDDLAPYPLLVILLFTGKAIIQTKLFDFRIALSQVMGTFVTVGVAGLLYQVLALVIREIVFVDQPDSAQLLLSILFTLTAILFYRRAYTAIIGVIYSIVFSRNYNPGRLLEQLNLTIVAETELEPLLEKTSELVEKHLDASFCGFYIRETSYFSSRFIAYKKNKIPLSDLEKIRQLTPTVKNRIHSAEIEPVTTEEKLLNEVLSKNNIEVLGRLVSTIAYDVAGVGYILLGPKKTSAVYSEQDLRIMEIVANELVIATENALRLEEIEQFNVTLQKKIDSATKELKDSNKKLLALDEAKDEFVSMASHQLRTPLTSIKGYISMVLEGDAGKISDAQKKMLGQAFFSSQRMVYLISDLLNVSRLKTGKFIIEPRPVNLAEIVESELDQLREGAVAKNQTLSFSKPKQFPILNLDNMKIRQVVMNFTDNAMYYTPVGGKITIELKDKKKSIEFTVKDSGIGVPKKEQAKLFTKFYRAENARKARPDGTGLGLFMAKKVIVAQGGAIIFESKEGKGSTFGFSFPKEKLEVKTKDNS